MQITANTFADLATRIGFYVEGREAVSQGLTFDDCPYPNNTSERAHWQRGYDDASQDMGDAADKKALTEACAEYLESYRRAVALGYSRAAERYRVMLAEATAELAELVERTEQDSEPVVAAGHLGSTRPAIRN